MDCKIDKPEKLRIKFSRCAILYIYVLAPLRLQNDFKIYFPCTGMKN